MHLTHYNMYTNHNIKRFLLLTILLLGVSSISGQNPYLNDSESDSKVFIGGNLGFSFGNITLVDVSPLVGYKVTEQFVVGIGATYKYYKYNDFYYDPYSKKYFDRTANYYGARLFSRYHFAGELIDIMEYIFVHAEYEYLWFDYDIYERNTIGEIVKYKKHAEVPSYLIGPGYRQSIGDNSYFTFLVLFNLNEVEETPYSNPIIRFGFDFGL